MAADRAGGNASASRRQESGVESARGSLAAGLETSGGSGTRPGVAAAGLRTGISKDRAPIKIAYCKPYSALHAVRSIDPGIRFSRLVGFSNTDVGGRFFRCPDLSRRA